MTSVPVLEQLNHNYKGAWRVNCYGCHVSTWNNCGYTREQAIAAWNYRRAAARAEKEES